jgi:hypothetical protein
MKKMIWFTVISILFLVFIVPALLSSALSMIPANIQPGYNPDIRLSVYSVRDFTQYFISQTDNLTAIGLSIRNPNLKNKSDVFFNLFDNGGNLVRKVVINGQNLEDGSFVKFVFPPIADSKGKKYYFNLSTPGAGAEETLEVFIIPPDGKSGITEDTYLGETHSGGTAIVLYGKTISRSNTILKVYSDLFSRLWPFHSQKSL